MGIFQMIMLALTGLPAVLDALKVFIAALGSLYDNVSGGNDKVAAIMADATNVVNVVEADATVAAGWMTKTYPTIESLLADIPGIAKLIYGTASVVNTQGVDVHTALTSVQLAANNLKNPTTAAA